MIPVGPISRIGFTQNRIKDGDSHERADFMTNRSGGQKDIADFMFRILGMLHINPKIIEAAIPHYLDIMDI